MKIISWKTAIVALACGAVMIYKILNFDGMADIVLIGCLGYGMVKCIHVAISKEAYEEDIKNTEKRRTLYCEIFGKFAYIAADIPIILILFIGLLVSFCPITTALRVIIVFLIGFSAAYAIWFCWYISKKEGIVKESDEWDKKSLSTENEKAWKRSDFWHNICYGIVGALLILYMFFGNPKVYINNGNLEEAITNITENSITLEEIVPFEWTTVYRFDPYTSIERIEKITGSKSPTLKESVSEGMTHFVFMNGGDIAASVCAYPTNVGYSLYFYGGENTSYTHPDGGYSHIEYGDKIIFDVTRKDGIVELYAHIDT